MDYKIRDGRIEINCGADFDLYKTFECGQCFRWNADDNARYTGVAKNKLLRLWNKDDNTIVLDSGKEDFEETWQDYFDLSQDYTLWRDSIEIDDYMKMTAEYGKGIRLLRQDRWEALCSFIVSQCNNIPRIKRIIETLCELFGERIECADKEYYSFPTADRLADTSEGDLRPLRCGYRADYIISAAKAVAYGEIDLERLAEGSYLEALRGLKKLKGVGDKVANCVILYGLWMREAFPIDVWMKRALALHYGKSFDPSVFGKAAGLAQQYIFYYTRSGNS